MYSGRPPHSGRPPDVGKVSQAPRTFIFCQDLNWCSEFESMQEEEEESKSHVQEGLMTRNEILSLNKFNPSDFDEEAANKLL